MALPIVGYTILKPPPPSIQPVGVDKVRTGEGYEDTVAWMRDYIREELASQLYPTSRMIVTGQNDSTPASIQLGTYGTCEDNDGHDYYLLLPYATSVSKDEYGLGIDGAPSVDDDVQRMNSGGSDMVLGRLSHDVKALPFLSGMSFDDPIYATDYGNYNVDGGITPWTTSRYVKKPRVAIAKGDGIFKDAAGFLRSRTTHYLAGLNITITDAPPAVAPGATAAAGAGLTPNVDYQYALAYHRTSGWSQPGPAAAILTTKGNGTENCQASVTWNVGGSLPAGVDQIAILRTTAADGAFSTLMTTSSPSGSTTDSTADGSLSAFTQVTAGVAVSDWQVYAAEPPTSIHTPAGVTSWGPWAQTSDLTGFNPAALPNGHLFFALDVDDPHDIAHGWVRQGDGTIPDVSSFDIYFDPATAELGSTRMGVVSAFFTGQVAGSLATNTSAHDPTDADVIYAMDGSLYINQQYGSVGHFYRGGGSWVMNANMFYFAGVDASGETFNHRAGDFGMGTDGSLWYCTTGGTPGTWIAAGGTTYIAGPGVIIEDV